MDGPLEVEAARVEWAQGAMVAEGGVEVRFGAHALAGARATWDGTTLVVEDGVYRRPEGTLAFDRAEVHPAEGTAVLVETRVETGGAAIEADRLELGEGMWTAEGATVVPCACTDGGTPALGFRARRITVVPDRVVVVHGGVVQVFEVPLLPVPYWRIPLDPRRFRLLFPEVGWGEYGPSASIQGRGGVGTAFVQGGPAWRLDRGLRGEVAVTAPGLSAQGALGWDALAEQVRGAGVARGGTTSTIAGAAVRAGVDAAWLSDADYLADYAVDYVARGTRWRDSRAVLAVGPSTLDVWLPDDGSVGALARERVAWELGRGRAVSVTPRIGVAVVGSVDEVAPLGELGVGARAAGGTTWFAAEARADVTGRLTAPGAGGAGFPGALSGWSDGLGAWGAGLGGWGEGLARGPLSAWGDGGTGLGGTIAAEAAVPMWSAVGPVRIQWWPGMRAEARAGWAPGEVVGAALRAGPAIRASTATRTGGVDVDAALLQDGTGWRPAASVDVHLARISVRGQVDPEVQAGEVRWMPGPLTLAAGTAHAAELWLGWGDAALALGRLRTGAGLAWNLDAVAYSGADARLGYDDGCTAATLTARFAPDRAVPDLGLALTLRK